MDVFGFLLFWGGLGYLFDCWFFLVFATGMLVHAHVRCTPAVHMMQTDRENRLKCRK